MPNRPDIMAKYKEGDLVRICVRNSGGMIFEGDLNHGKLGLVLEVKEFYNKRAKKSLSATIYAILIDGRKHFYGEHCLQGFEIEEREV